MCMGTIGKPLMQRVGDVTYIIVRTLGKFSPLSRYVNIFLAVLMSLLVSASHINTSCYQTVVTLHLIFTIPPTNNTHLIAAML